MKNTIGDQATIQNFLGVHIHSDEQGRCILSNWAWSTVLYPTSTSLIDTNSLPPPRSWRAFPSQKLELLLRDCKLNYLAHMTRPDISMAIHNCTQFTTSPTYLHEQAMKQIGRYLATARSHGLIYQPDSKGTLDMYTDADFAGTWHKEYSHSQDCVLLQTGFVILGKLLLLTIFEDYASCIALATKDIHTSH